MPKRNNATINLKSADFFDIEKFSKMHLLPRVTLQMKRKRKEYYALKENLQKLILALVEYSTTGFSFSGKTSRSGCGAAWNEILRTEGTLVGKKQNLLPDHCACNNLKN